MRFLLAGMLAVSLIACEANNDDDATEKAVETIEDETTTTTTPTTSEGATLDQAFTASVRGNTSVFDGVSNESMITAAQQACSALDSGLSPDAVVGMALEGFGTEQGTPESEGIAFMIGAGIQAYCPQHAALFDAP